jgi:hypothetical protein
MTEGLPSPEPEPAVRDGSDEEPLASDLIESLLIEVREMSRNVSVLARSAIDRARLSARKLLLWIVAGLLGSVAVVSLLVKASLLFLDGLAAGLASLFGDRAWMGGLLAGLLALLAVAAGVGWFWHSAIRRFRSRTLRRYAPATSPPAEREVLGAA